MTNKDNFHPTLDYLARLVVYLNNNSNYQANLNFGYQDCMETNNTHLDFDIFEDDNYLVSINPSDLSFFVSTAMLAKDQSVPTSTHLAYLASLIANFVKNVKDDQQITFEYQGDN